MNDFLQCCGRRRIIDRLRKAFPGKWKFDFRERRWDHESGWGVQPYSKLAPKHDHDDETCVTEYRRTDTHEIIYL